MSYSYSHVMGTSLPNDYSLISQFASKSPHLAAEDGEDEDATSDVGEHDLLDDDILNPDSPLLAGAEPSGSSRPDIHRAGSSERSPLLRGQVSYEAINRHTGNRKVSFGGHSTRSAHWNGASEQPPLLADVPRLVESVDNTPMGEEEKSRMWWQEARVLARYTAPVFGTHVLEYSLSVVSVVSIGHISTNHLAAVTLGTMTSNVTGLSVILGFVSALDSLLPQAWTAAPHLVGLWSQRMAVLLAIVMIPVFFVWFSAEPILLMLRQEPDVAYLASLYLRWLSIGLPAYAFNAVSRRFLQSQGLMHVPTLIVIVVSPINVLMNWLLVWGPKPIRLGYIGAPIATAISFNLIAIFTLIYAVKYSPRKAWHPFGASAFKSLGLLLRLGFAGVGQLATEWWGWELIGLAASQLGPAALAAQSVLLVSSSTSYQAPYALSVAASVRIGNHLGAGNALRAKIATQAALLGCLFLMLIFVAIFIIFRNQWGYIFNDDPEVVKMVAQILPLVGLFQIVDGNSTLTAGVFRARGRQSLSALLNFISYYIIGIPLGLVLTFRAHTGLYGLWIGLAVALFMNAILTTYMVLKTDWDHEVVKVAALLASDQGEGESHSKAVRRNSARSVEESA